MDNEVDFYKEYHGVKSRLDIPVPSAVELARLCTTLNKDNVHYNTGLAYPTDGPVYWIKYGPSVVWDELYAQNLAHKELNRLGSHVKVPAVYYACQLGVAVGIWSYVVMDYIPGSTVGKLLQDTEDTDYEDFLFSRVALALSELHRIPVPAGRPPSGINGGYIRHYLFDDQEAPRDYRNADELELHLNKLLTLTRRGNHQITGLAQEPMVFCYSDMRPHNFMVDDEGNISVVDFAHSSFVPSSFSKMVLVRWEHKIGRDLRSMVVIPATDGIDNTLALCAAAEAMVMGWASFVNLGCKLFGDSREGTLDEMGTPVPLLDEQGRPVEVSYDVEPRYQGPLPPPPPGFKRPIDLT